MSSVVTAMDARMGCGELLDIKELAEKLGIAPQTVRRLVAKGELPRPLKIGRAIRWPENLVDQWLAKQWEKMAV